jgi:dephospho-CoA kinase
MRAQVNAYHAALVLVEIPLLFEAGWHKDVDAVLVVYARKAVRCLRIMRRDGVSRREASKAMVAQMDLREKADQADFLIDNSRAWTVTRSEVVSLGNLLSERFPG